MQKPGITSLTVYTGPMFSSKSGSLIMGIERAGYAHLRIKVGKSGMDTRTNGEVATRRIKDGTPSVLSSIEATPISSREEFLAFTAGDDYDVLAFDEVQFFTLDSPMQDTLGWFGREIRDLLHRRKDTSLQILIAGLDTDATDLPFGVMPGLMAIADRVEKLTAVCMVCGSFFATKSQRLSSDKGTVSVGDAGIYEARCRLCFTTGT